MSCSASAQALGITGTGAFGMNSDFDDEEFELRWMRKLGQGHRPAGLVPADRSLLRTRSAGAAS